MVLREVTGVLKCAFEYDGGECFRHEYDAGVQADANVDGGVRAPLIGKQAVLTKHPS